MEILLTRDQESQLSQLATDAGRDEEDFARELFSRGLATETKFVAGVKAGQDAVLREDFVDQAEVWAGVESALHS